MAEFSVTASVSMTTYVEADGYIMSNDSDVIDFQDVSSWYGDSFRSDGGSVEIRVEAENEDDARERATQVLDAMSFDSHNDFEWELDDYSIEDIERITPPMDLERASDILRAFIQASTTLTAEQRDAFEFLVNAIADKLAP